MQPALVEWSIGRDDRRVAAFLRRPAFSAEAEAVAAAVLASIRVAGDAAVSRSIARFDRVRLAPRQFRVSAEEIAAAARQVTPAFRRAAREAHRRILCFARAGLRREWRIRTADGGTLGEVYRPLDRIGAYIPGGAAPLASTALMTLTLAQAAGVPARVACTPCRKDGSVDPNVLFALALAGATEIYRVGGIQAIGMLAYGTATVPRVQKIVGPGGAYVTAAKRLVYGQVALDLVAGPSEIAVLADGRARATCVAADLLSQTEHGTGDERALLVTPSPRLARTVQAEVLRQIAVLPRGEAVRRVIRRGGMLLVVVPDLDQGLELCNRFAPEHLELLVARPRRWLRKVRAAGAVFLGPWTPEAAGDFVAGPSHVLPTGGAAAMFSGLTVDDFQRRSSVIALTRADLHRALPVIEAFGCVEGLDGHVRSATARFAPPAARTIRRRRRSTP